jgi:hypothetical protein
MLALKAVQISAQLNLVITGRLMLTFGAFMPIHGRLMPTFETFMLVLGRLMPILGRPTPVYRKSMSRLSRLLLGHGVLKD